MPLPPVLVEQPKYLMNIRPCWKEWELEMVIERVDTHKLLEGVILAYELLEVLGNLSFILNWNSNCSYLMLINIYSYNL